jgi:putative peptide zinc metalloprotease protein
MKKLLVLGKQSALAYAAAGVLLLAGVTGVVAGSGAFSGSATPSPTAATLTASGQAQAALPQGGGGKNIVQVINREDGHFKIDGKVKLNQIHGPNALPVNQALAFSSCTDCQTMAIALEINLISRRAANIQPQNAAVAINYQCTRCITVAKAFQYNITVVDPTVVPEDVKKLIHRMNAEIKDLKTSKVGFLDAYNRVNQVVAEFESLADDLKVAQDEARDSTTPGAGPPPVESASPEPSPTSDTSPSTSASPTVSP